MAQFSTLIGQLLEPPGPLQAITSYAVWGMLGVFGLAVLLRLLQRAPRFTGQASTLLTSIGILGTFLGIVIGLQGVDLTSTTTEESVRTLLGGMTLAFSSSLVGMALSIVYKLLLTVLPSAGTGDANRQVLELLQSTATAAHDQNNALSTIAKAIGAGDYSGTAELLVSMNEMLDQRLRTLVDTNVSQQRQIAQINESMSRLVRALVEDDAQSLGGQMRGLRNELADRHRQNSTVMTEMVDSVMQQGRDQVAQTRSIERMADGQQSLLEAQQLGHEHLKAGFAELNTTVVEELAGRLDVVRETAKSGLDELGNQIDVRLENIDLSAVRNVEHTAELVTGLERVRTGLDGPLATLAMQDEARQKCLEALVKLSDELRDEYRTNAVQVNEHLSSMATLLERSPTDEIIDALKTTIREFNDHISEQFGENFAELNTAVGRLLEWQESYRHQLSDMRTQFDTSVAAIQTASTGIEAVEGSMEKIHGHAAQIPEHMSRLGEVVQINQQHVRTLEDHLGAFAETRDRAVEALPKISEIVTETVQGVATASDALSKAVQEGASDLKGSAGVLAEAIGSGTKELQTAFTRSLDGYIKATDSINETAEGISQRTQAEVIRLYDHLQETVKRAHEDSAGSNRELINTQFENLEKVRQEETEAVIRDMARALAQITGRFTDDYAKLVGAMDSIVQKAANDAAR